LYEKPLASLVFMLLHPESFEPMESGDKTSECPEGAPISPGTVHFLASDPYAMAKRLIEVLLEGMTDLKLKVEDESHMFSSGSWMHPGPKVKIPARVTITLRTALAEETQRIKTRLSRQKSNMRKKATKK
jgi:hypothetical protein